MHTLGLQEKQSLPLAPSKDTLTTHAHTMQSTQRKITMSMHFNMTLYKLTHKHQPVQSKVGMHMNTASVKDVTTIPRKNLDLMQMHMTLYKLTHKHQPVQSKAGVHTNTASVKVVVTPQKSCCLLQNTIMAIGCPMATIHTQRLVHTMQNTP